VALLLVEEVVDAVATPSKVNDNRVGDALDEDVIEAGHGASASFQRAWDGSACDEEITEWLRSE
jgi:hypothetical protein